VENGIIIPKKRKKTESWIYPKVKKNQEA